MNRGDFLKLSGLAVAGIIIAPKVIFKGNEIHGLKEIGTLKVFDQLRYDFSYKGYDFYIRIEQSEQDILTGIYTALVRVKNNDFGCWLKLSKELLDDNEFLLPELSNEWISMYSHKKKFKDSPRFDSGLH